MFCNLLRLVIKRKGRASIYSRPWALARREQLIICIAPVRLLCSHGSDRIKLTSSSELSAEMDLTERETHLASLARELHSTCKLSPTQIRQRAGFLDGNDQPYIPLETIQNWLDGIPAAAPASSRPTSSQPTPAPPRQQWLDGTPAAAPASLRPP